MRNPPGWHGLDGGETIAPMFLGDLTWQTFLLACGVGLVAGIVGLTLRYGVQSWLDGFAGLARDVFGWAGARAVDRRAGGDPWFCATCHSQNLATSKRCYRGCGERATVEDRAPLTGEAPAAARGGTARRKV